MNRMENYLHDFLRVLFVHRRLIKRVFLLFALITLLLPLVLKQTFEISADIIEQSKKLSQADVSTALSQESDKFIPPTLTDMETEVNILRSTTLIRQTIAELQEEGSYDPRPGLLNKWLVRPLKTYIANPIRNYVVNPLRHLLGLETDPVRDTTLDAWTEQAAKALTIETRPGSNEKNVVYTNPDPEQATR